MHIGETEQPRLVNLDYRKSRILKDEWERVLSQAQGLPSSHHCIVINCLVSVFRELPIGGCLITRIQE